MDKEQTKECIKVMQAFVDGAEVLSVGDLEDSVTDSPLWNWDNNNDKYQIKPREYWVANVSGGLVEYVFESLDKCVTNCSHRADFIKAIQLVVKDDE